MIDSKDLNVRVLKQGKAYRVVFFYPGEEGTYLEGAEVTLYENGIVHIKAEHEETTSHLQNVEVIWAYLNENQENTNLRLLRPSYLRPEPESQI